MPSLCIPTRSVGMRKNSVGGEIYFNFDVLINLAVTQGARITAPSITYSQIDTRYNPDTRVLPRTKLPVGEA